MMKKIHGVLSAPHQHWVGDGFPVRTLFSYQDIVQYISPFLLLDYAGPHHFEPSPSPRGVGQHPHRGFETVTVVYEGEVAHRDSTGEGGVIGPGDVQWMTAASGILHEEFHSPIFGRTGGSLRMVQLWVNLPAKAKAAPPRYQGITAAEIPSVELGQGARARVIAGELTGVKGVAQTFTKMNLWDVRLEAGASIAFDLPEGHNAAVAVLSGAIIANNDASAGEADVVILDRSGRDLLVDALEDSILLVMTGEPIDEPIVGYGPFVMNTEAEIRQALADLRSGRFGRLAEPTV
ncbi:pirin family protein [Phenylobacterium sp.]|jgi:hypothetical protein|uniref:pirin family protein n=1 Tax=Phenylobacterium sp. TaxID=1871053 RepID=UPI002E32A12C|nr:pirin family protein [Phenylobacterium sp.]HEX3366068.1 pirin family protein [Phenylobacterium sp.]